MYTAYMHTQSEMGALEAAFEAERQALLSGNEREVEGLLREKRERELAYLRGKQQREERFQREIEAMLVHVGPAVGRSVSSSS